MNLKGELKKRMKEDSGYLITAYPILYRKVILELIKPFRKVKIDKVVSPEAKGLFFGPTVAYELKKSFVFVSKGGRIQKNFVLSRRFKDYTNKFKSLDVGKITIKKGDRVLIVDDVFESGGSGRAIIEMIEELGGNVVGISLVYNKLSKKDESFFKKYYLNYLVRMKK